MYDGPSTTSSYSRFWIAWRDRIRARGIEAPDELNRLTESESVWTSPDLFMSQTCGYPYSKSLRGKVRLVATPHYTADGCEGPNYSSWLITHTETPARSVDQLRGARAAINGPNSQSGYNSFRAIIAPLAEGCSFFSEVKISGSHRASMQLIADGEADCATVDAVSWAIVSREDPALGRSLKQLTATQSLPGLPFITSADRSDEDLITFRQTLFEVLADPLLDETLNDLLMSGASVLADANYSVCLDMEADAMSAGYPKLA
ncbi:MAG: PhnD/SsuA/transferrin family substrate-binding protein [Planctomycetota bacterium]